jgi:SAM-dependent methyltransferase
MEKFEILWERAVKEINADPKCTTIYEFGGLKDGESKLFPDKTYKTINLNPNEHTDIVADVHDTGLPSGSAGAIVACNLLEHCHTPHQVVEEMKRLLQPGGYVLISVPFIHPYHGGYDGDTFWPDYWRFTKDGHAFLFRDFDMEMGTDGGMFYAAGEFVPPKMGFIGRILAALLRSLDRFYPSGGSKHSYLVYGKKKQ